MPSLPFGADLASVKMRLRRGGYLVDAVRKPNPAHYQPDFDADELRNDQLERLRQLGYTLGDYDRDVEALTDAYLAAAAEIGEMLFERMQSIASRFSADYGQSGPKLTALAEALRDWLPFVSYSRYVPLFDQGLDLPPLSELPENQVTPELHPMARLHEEGPPMPTLGEVKEVLNANFRRWRRDPLTEDDARGQVLANSPAANERVLRSVLYAEHPVLLMVPSVRKPPEVEQLLAFDVEMREEALTELVAEIVTGLEKTIATFRAELQAGHETDWNRLEPLLLFAEGYLLRDEPEESYLRVLLPRLRRKVQPWTLRDALSAACLVVAVALTAASFGVGGVALAVITGIGLAFDAASLVVMLHLTQQENALRTELNRFELVDAALAVAAQPDDTGMMVVLGLLGLGLGGLALNGAVRLARRVESTLASRAHVVSPPTASRPATDTLAAAASAPPPAASARTTQTAAATRSGATRPRTAGPTESPPSPAIVDDAAESAPASSNAVSGQAARAEPEPLALPRAARGRPRQFLDETDAFADELENLRLAQEQSRAMGITEQFADDLASFQEAIDETAARLVSEVEAVTQAAESSGRGGMSAARAGNDVAAISEGELKELARAMEDGLARLLLTRNSAWDELAQAAEAAGGPLAVERLRQATARGLTRVAAEKHGDAAVQDQRDARMRRQLEARAKEGSAVSARDPRATYDPSERASNDPGQLAGQRFSSATKPDVIGRRGTAGARMTPNGVEVDDPYGILTEHDLQVGGTGVRRISARPAQEKGARHAITVEVQVQSRGGRRLDFNRSTSLISASELGVPVGRFHQAHASGAGFNAEAMAGMTNAPAEINLVAQNAYIEEWLRQVARSIHREGGVVMARIEVLTWDVDELSPELRAADFMLRVSYEAELSLPGRPTVRIRTTVYASRPPSAEIDHLLFDDSAMQSLSPADRDAYRRYLETRETDELREVMLRTALAKK